MADVSVTAADVSGSGGTRTRYTAGEAMTAGMPVYQHTDGKVYKALSDTAAHAAIVGITLNGADADGQLVTVQNGGAIDIGAPDFTLQATAVYLSANAGKMCPAGDLTTSSYVTLIGLSGEVGDIINLSINATGLLYDSVAV